jgi:outer membrane protein assembly factor BamB
MVRSGSAEPGPGLPRRGMLLAGAGLLSTAGLGAVIWEASRPDAAPPRTTAMREPPVRPQTMAPREPPARRAPIWQAKVSVPRPQLMAEADGVICVAGDQGVDWTRSGAREVVQALDARDGCHLWTFTVRTGVRGMGVVDPPGLAASHDCVYVTIDRLYCLRARDGAKVWSDPVPLTIGLAAGPDAVYAVQETLFALSSRDGSRLWSYAANAGANPTPVLVNGVIYMLGLSLPSNSLLLAIRASDGARLWDSSPGPGGGWLACDGQTVCAVSGSDVQIQGNSEPPPTQLSTYRASDGKLLYRSAANAGFSAAPAMTAGMAFALNAGNAHTARELRAVDPSDGRTLWSYPGASAAPAAAHGRIYTASPAGDLVALNASDGTPVWQCPIRFTAGPLVAGNTVYVCDRTTVYAVRA